MAARLPFELIRQIVDECVILTSRDYDGVERPKKGLTRLAMVNKQWLAVVEPMIWCSICVQIPYDFEHYASMASRSSRRRSLVRLSLTSGVFNDNDSCTDDHSAISTEYETSNSNSECSNESEDNEDQENGHDEGEEGNSTDDDNDTSSDDSGHNEGGHDYDYRGDSSNWQQWDDVTVIEDQEYLEARADKFERLVQGLFEELYGVWEELASWGEDLNLKRLELDLSFEGSMLRCLGRGFRSASAVEDHLVGRDWLSNLRRMPKLKSVLSFESNSDCDGLWLAISVCTLCKSLPNLQKLHLVAADKVKTWYYVRKHMREGCIPRTKSVIKLILVVLARKLSNLPASLQEIQLNMSFQTNINQKAPVPAFLHNGHDQFSCAIRKLPLSLVRLIL